VIAAPELPFDEVGKFLAAAYIAVVALVLVYAAIIGARIARVDRDLSDRAKNEK
jgi:hypothetical protein